ncbi:MAG: hypothetical protein WBA89_07445, partial [Microcoleus sp.]
MLLGPMSDALFGRCPIWPTVPHLSEKGYTITPEFVKIMSQVITAKLKLNLTAEQKALVTQTTLAYRDALNYTSQVAFDAGKTSNGGKLQKAVYNELRVNFGLGAQMACNVPRQVSGTYKTLWTKVKQSND